MSRKILITGASGALGQEIRNIYLNLGESVISVSRTSGDFRCDFSSTDELSKLLNQLRGIDFKLVIFAHASPEESDSKKSMESSMEFAQKYFMINYFSVFKIIQTLKPIPGMRFVVLLGGGAGGKPINGSYLYSPLKSALASLIETFAEEISTEGSCIYGISPGPIKGGMGKRILTDSLHGYHAPIFEDARKVESVGNLPSLSAERVIRLIDLADNFGNEMNGRLFSAIHDSPTFLDEKLTNMEDSTFRIRRSLI